MPENFYFPYSQIKNLLAFGTNPTLNFFVKSPYFR